MCPEWEPPIALPIGCMTRQEADEYCVGCLLGYVARCRKPRKLTEPERDFVRWLAREALANWRSV